MRELAGADGAPVICECADPACVVRLPVGQAAYERARSRPRWYVVAPGHAIDALEAVVEHGPAWEIVLRSE